MRSALMACLVLTVGCSGNPQLDGGTGGGSGFDGGSGGGGGGSNALTLAQFCQQREAALCAAGVTCGLFASPAGCAATFEQQRLDYAAFDDCVVGQAAVADGRTSFDGTAAADCLATAATTCQTLVSTGVCRNVFRPLVTLGGSCFDDRECVDGTYCEKSMTCPGTCRARAPAGQVIGNGERCLEGQYTSIESDGGLGLLFVCRPVVPAGQPCPNVTACAAGLTCRGDTNTCGTPRADGQACVVVDGGIFGPTIVQDCERLHACRPLDAGIACAPLGGVGEGCLLGTCKADLRCIDGRCAPPGTTGQACSNVNDCASGFYCQPTGGQPFGPGLCQPREPVGGACFGDSDCVRGLVCAQVPPADGGVLPDRRCAAGDAGLPCADRTP